MGIMSPAPVPYYEDSSLSIIATLGHQPLYHPPIAQWPLLLYDSRHFFFFFFRFLCTIFLLFGNMPPTLKEQLIKAERKH